MNFTKDNIEDLFESISFKSPSTLVEIKAFYEFYKKIESTYTFDEILGYIGISYKKRDSFKNKMNKGFTPKDLEESLKYAMLNTTEIRAILYVFQKF